jgi:hypothetical protein
MKEELFFHFVFPHEVQNEKLKLVCRFSFEVKNRERENHTLQSEEESLKIPPHTPCYAMCVVVSTLTKNTEKTPQNRQSE